MCWLSTCIGHWDSRTRRKSAEIGEDTFGLLSYGPFWTRNTDVEWGITLRIGKNDMCHRVDVIRQVISYLVHCGHSWDVFKWFSGKTNLTVHSMLLQYHGAVPTRCRQKVRFGDVLQALCLRSMSNSCRNDPSNRCFCMDLMLVQSTDVKLPHMQFQLVILQLKFNASNQNLRT